MQINGTGALSNLANLSFGGATAAVGSAPSTSAQFDVGRVILGDAFGRANDAVSALASLDELLSNASPSRSRGGRAASASPLVSGSGSLVATATTLRSGAEVNATLTSFSPFGPSYTLPATSTAEPTLDGIYDGSNGSGTLTFESRKDGDHPGDKLQFRVRDPLGVQIDVINVKKDDPIDEQYTLSNGLILTLGAGTLAKDDTFTVEVFADIGSVVDPDKAFNGVRNDKPNLQYGLSVTDGSFAINGINIVVNASDSINDVLARITASAADVTAEFDVATEQVLLTRNTAGSAYDITLAGDSSGFLAATKLDSAVRELGTDAGITGSLSELLQFSSVVSGTFQVNGVGIALDVAVDTLDDLLTRINSSAANVNALSSNNRVFIEAGHRKDSLTLEDGGTGLFDALNIREGRYRAVKRDGIDLASASAIATSVRSATAAVAKVLEGNYGSNGVPASVSRLHSDLRSVLGSAEAKLVENSEARFGLDFDLSGASASVVRNLNVNDMVDSLRVDFTAFKAAFVGASPDARDGFVRQLLDIMNQFTASARREIGNGGFLQNLSV